MPKIIDMSGQKFDRLIAISPVGNGLWCDECKVVPNTYRHRVNKMGMSPLEALSIPSKRGI